MTRPDPTSDPVRRLAAVRDAVLRPVRGMRGVLDWMRPSEPLELQIVGRTLFHAAVVGLGAGLLGCAFFAGVEYLETVLLEQIAGYQLLRARGEHASSAPAHGVHLWLLVVIPAVGALLGGLLTRFAPECRGGGGDATIEAFHLHGGVVRRRVLWVKPVASILTLGSGGSGGREGPTMQIGAALGSTVGRYLASSARERRVLMVAGIAAGISAVFRTPLGAALIAIEMLYRDDFESEALIPAVLASVVAYSVSITVFGQATLFGYLAPYTFQPGHIPLYIVLALVLAGAGSAFVGVLRIFQRVSSALPVPAWARPGVGGLALGLFVVAIVHVAGPAIGRPDQGLGVLGGGYGAAQVAISGADWLPATWTGVQILVLLAIAKIIATGFTVGFGGSAGDFAPLLAIGGVLGGAFGLAASLVLEDPTIQPGAFALVGMGVIYGGVANTPLAALVLVCEMAGSYDLLVPLMLAEGVAFVALRRVSLYRAQARTVHESPVHREEIDPMRRLCCRDVVRLDRAFVPVASSLRVDELARLVEQAEHQDVFPVLDEHQRLCGVISAESLRIVASNPELHAVAVAADLMAPPIAIHLGDDLRTVAQLMVARDLRSLPVLDERGTVIAMVDQHDLATAVVSFEPRARTDA